MINISNILTSLLVTACIVKEDQVRDMKQEASKDQESHFRQIREEERIKQQI
jgi:cytochrome c-type biogenesis protein CcmH/NrfF